MEKGRPRRAGRSDKSEKEVQEQHRRSLWSSNSKFNRILVNLERSIMNQFGNHHDSNSGGDVSKSNTKQKLHLTQHQTSKTRATTNSVGAKEGQLQKDPHQSSARGKVTSTAPSSSQSNEHARAIGKMTLNKYQQQLASTLRTNQLVACNKLSIPPPHAYDETSSQQDKFMFSGKATSMHGGNSKERDLPTSSKTAPSATIRTSTKSANKNVQQVDENSRRISSSPASSAKSLPNLTSKTGSHLFNKKSKDKITNEDDEESGFSTYQSRRAVFANNNDSSMTNSSTIGEQNHSNNMILMQQVPHSYVNCRNGTTNGQNFATQQPNLGYNPNFMLQQHQQQQQQPTNTQQILVASNQVPILSPVNPSNNNRYTNNQSFLHLSPIQQLKQQHPQQIQYNDQQLFGLHGPQSIDHGQQIYANAPPKPRRYQFYDGTGQHQNQQQAIFSQMMPPMTTTGPTTTVATMVPMRQNIQQHFIPQQPTSFYNRQQQAFSQLAASQQHHQPGQPYSLDRQYQPGQQQQHQLGQQYQFGQQQQLVASTEAPFYNMSHLSVPSLCRSDDETIRSNQPRQQQFLNSLNYSQQPQNSNYIQAQQRPPVMIPTISLPKSKSSLDSADLLRFKSNKQLGVQPLATDSNNLRYQQNQPIYGSRLDNYNAVFLQGNQNDTSHLVSNINSAGSNLQRSKSVTHLLPEYNQSRQFLDDNVHVKNMQQQPKFLQMSSISSTNLNSTGVVSETQSVYQPSSQISKYPSSHHLTNLYQQYPDSILRIQQQNNQLFLPSTLIQTKQNNWATQANGPVNLHNYKPKPSMAPPNSSALSSNGNKFVRQSYFDSYNTNQDTDSSLKPSLDDKIRHLLIDNNDNNSNSLGCVAGKNQNNGNDATYHRPLSNTVNLSSSSQSTWSIRANDAKQRHYPTEPANSGGPLAEAHYMREQGAVKGTPMAASSNLSFPSRTNANVAKSSLNQHHLLESGPTDSLFSNDISIMGNSQQRRYNITQIPGNLHNNTSETIRAKNEAANSHLIVDLTTPRVLAKTQTTLLAVNNQPNSRATQSSWSINQVGLPELNASNQIVTSSNQRAPVAVDTRQSSSLFNTTNGNPKSDSTITDKLPESSKSAASDCERTAPYYYSDLRSEEQRQALLSIVQQKSLSPPPQLLSRSTDQSSTRLAPKSATLHPIHAPVLNESLAQGQISQKTNSCVQQNNSSKSGASIDFGSATNIARNIDKLFESPISQSMTDIQKTCKDQVDCGQQKKQQQPRPRLIQNKNNPFCSDSNGDSDDTISSADASESEQISPGKLSSDQSSSSKNENGLNGFNVMRDNDDDFIEFLSSDSSDRRSQFEASQFSASDFNTSASESSTSGPCNDSLNSMIIPKRSPNAKCSGNETTGILKNGNNNNNNKLYNYEHKNTRPSSPKKNLHNSDGDDGGDKGKFNNVLGNVIDVDVCPMNKLSECSPVDSHHLPTTCIN